MKNKIATTIEQSKKLLELWIDPNTADMYWEYDSFQGFHRLELFEDGFPKNLNKDDIPAWSLSALLSLLPLSISKEKGYPYLLEWQFWNDNSLRYVNPYSDERECLVDIYSDHDEKLKDCIDTVFEMIVYLKENKLI